MKNNAINTYLKELSKQLCCSGKEKNEILSSLKNRLSEFESEHSAALKYEDIVEQFGYTINLHGIGTLFLSAGSEGYENPKDCTPHRVKAKRLCIKADPEMKKFMKRLKFERWK